MGNKKEAQKHLERGMSFYNMDRFSDAITEFTKAINLYPSFAGFYSNRGAAYGQQGKYSEAIADFEKALQLDPGNPQFRNNIVMTKRARGW